MFLQVTRQLSWHELYENNKFFIDYLTFAQWKNGTRILSWKNKNKVSATFSNQQFPELLYCKLRSRLVYPTPKFCCSQHFPCDSILSTSPGITFHRASNTVRPTGQSFLSHNTLSSSPTLTLPTTHSYFKARNRSSSKKISLGVSPTENKPAIMDSPLDKGGKHAQSEIRHRRRKETEEKNVRRFDFGGFLYLLRLKGTFCLPKSSNTSHLFVLTRGTALSNFQAADDSHQTALASAI